jgi:hypothetical protein
LVQAEQEGTEGTEEFEQQLCDGKVFGEPAEASSSAKPTEDRTAFCGRLIHGFGMGFIGWQEKNNLAFMPSLGWHRLAQVGGKLARCQPTGDGGKAG